MTIAAPVAAKAKEQARAAGRSEAEVEQAARDSIRAMMLIRTYRVRGHLAADLDPLHLVHRELPADLTPEYHGFTDADLDRPIDAGGARHREWPPIRDLGPLLRPNHCGNA